MKKGTAAAILYASSLASIMSEVNYESAPSKAKKQSSQKSAKVKKQRAKNKTAKKSRRKNRK